MVSHTGCLAEAYLVISGRFLIMLLMAVLTEKQSILVISDVLYTIYDETTSTSPIMFQILGKLGNIAKRRQVFDPSESARSPVFERISLRGFCQPQDHTENKQAWSFGGCFFSDPSPDQHSVVVI